MNNTGDPRRIEASPTKEFFIFMLTRDIPLIRAIVDLVDNCIDGARRLKKNGNYNGLWVRINLNKSIFQISDNCGGIPVDTARNYAFRFGRPKEMPKTEHSVGQFGIGMKRSIFKLGNKFKIISTTDNSKFSVEEDVEKWKELGNWEFHFKELKENLTDISADKIGTIITITSLHESVVNNFELANFRTSLANEIAAAHQISLDKGISISFNGLPLKMQPLLLLSSDKLNPVRWEHIYEESSESPINVAIYAGISDSNPTEAGWNIYCNGRLLLEHDQERITGWGESQDKAIPKFHNQYARFRGFVFFDSNDAEKLPWNTSKTGVDTDSAIFKAVRMEMINIMRPIIDFLNSLDREKDQDGSEKKPLEELIQSSIMTLISEVNKSETFNWPKEMPKIEKGIKMNNIQYQKPVSEVNKVKKVLKATSLKEVGEKTFEYFFNSECEE